MIVGIGTGAHETLIGNGTDVTTSLEIDASVSVSVGQIAISDGWLFPGSRSRRSRLWP